MLVRFQLVACASICREEQLGILASDVPKMLCFKPFGVVPATIARLEVHALSEAFYHECFFMNKILNITQLAPEVF
ncbi:MAG: hypothetical protein PHU80_03155, partial [Kiritimatiellae bacterium]|nr:hypothetical protein [Kiritimatiellia bacterium]